MVKSLRRLPHTPKHTTKEEEEKRIIEMFQEGYTYPQIAKELHKSITTIKDVKDRYDNSLLLKDKPRASEVYSLFRQGKGCFEISQKFNLDANEIKKIL
jgi:DNA-binding NarL/FixJ family response regulator